MKYRITFLLAVLALLILYGCASHQDIVGNESKREFRGAWIQCVNGQWQGMGRDKMQQTLTYQLNELQKDGVNAIIFQVRPECDALYNSKIEPWSRYLTGRQGAAPQPYWDPLEWMVNECHKRGMEIHAWINPYRAKTKGTKELASNHVAVRYPQRVFTYDGQYILNPGIPENRDYICMVVEDIVKRYDVDGLHIDDYFYPYPVAGQTIPDDAEYYAYNKGIKNKSDWRRHNVDLFIKQLGECIHKVKPWVKFGVSPFGIYRNQKNSSIGSNTNGLQNYDDLYADVLLWVNKGWIDYCVPQLYWEIGNKAADYETLIRWWNKYAAGRPLFIGEDVERTAKAADLRNKDMNQMSAKFRLHKEMNNVNGTVLWYAKAAVDNIGNYGSMLRNVYWKTPALQPRMPFIDSTTPGKVRSMKIVDFGNGPMLMWKAPNGRNWKNEAVKYVVYKFDKGEVVNISDAAHIVAITSDTHFIIKERKSGATYVVTALNRMSNESKAKIIKY